jgi:hypothetical protein
MSTGKITKELKAKWEKMNDVERWKWIIANPEGLVVQLDNDLTIVVELDEDLRYDDEHGDDELYLTFDEYIGSYAYDLLTAIGIESEGV